MYTHGGVTEEPGDVQQSAWSPVVELRQYALHPGLRETLIELFDGEFVETQEAVGIKVIGQFRDLDDANKFVWLRGFADMEARRRSLIAFYDGPVWEAHRDAANATMIDSDDVLLLRPARCGSAFRLDARRAAVGAGATPPGFVRALVLHLHDANTLTAAVAHFEHAVAGALADAGATPLAYFVTEPSENTFPRLPVREGEHVLVAFAGVPDRAALHRLDRGDADAKAARTPGLARPPVVLRLAPTSRSLVHGGSPACETLAL